MNGEEAETGETIVRGFRYNKLCKRFLTAKHKLDIILLSLQCTYFLRFHLFGHYLVVVFHAHSSNKTIGKFPTVWAFCSNNNDRIESSRGHHSVWKGSYINSISQGYPKVTLQPVPVLVWLYTDHLDLRALQTLQLFSRWSVFFMKFLRPMATHT